MEQKLKGQIALVTGGSRGIGAAISLRLAKAGAIVLINYRSNREAAVKVLEEIKKYSPDSELIAFDIANAKETELAVDTLLSKWEKIGILVCNAGISREALVPRANEAHFREVIDTNLIGNMNLVRILSRPMMKNRYGRIVCIGSVVGETGNKGQSAYAASKSALFGFAKSVALELGSRQVTCNIICPGFIETEMTHELSEDIKNVYKSKIPLERFGTADEVAGCVEFLVSPEAAYITGATIDINGGLLMR